MTVEELMGLKTGDLVRLDDNILSVVVHQETKVSWKYWQFISKEHPCLDVTVIAYNRLIRNDVPEKIKKLLVVSTEDKLSLEIQTKESELTNLKKEYEEIQRKNILDRIVPGNVYRFTYNEESYVRLVREIYEHKIYTTDLVHGHSDSFYIDAFKNVEHLPELTEAYKNFKTLLEKT